MLAYSVSRHVPMSLFARSRHLSHQLRPSPCNVLPSDVDGEKKRQIVPRVKMSLVPRNRGTSTVTCGTTATCVSFHPTRTNATDTIHCFLLVICPIQDNIPSISREACEKKITKGETLRTTATPVPFDTKNTETQPQGEAS